MTWGGGGGGGFHVAILKMSSQLEDHDIQH